MAKVNHEYLRETTFLSPIGLSHNSKRETTISELKRVRDSLNNYRSQEKKHIQKSR